MQGLRQALHCRVSVNVYFVFFRFLDTRKPGYLLKRSWDLVSGVISEVTIFIITYNPN